MVSPLPAPSVSKFTFILQESFLRSQGIVESSFMLDDASNLANSELG